MTGVEYELIHGQDPILYVIRKQERHSPDRGKLFVMWSLAPTLYNTNLLVLWCEETILLQIVLFTLDHNSSAKFS